MRDLIFCRCMLRRALRSHNVVRVVQIVVGVVPVMRPHSA